MQGLSVAQQRTTFQIAK